jgi:hypothetical protein
MIKSAENKPWHWWYKPYLPVVEEESSLNSRAMQPHKFI